jgi:predicted Ser/Thr protein kinase
MRTIGRYEIVRELGRGAMGVVYLARDPHLNREVALKICALPEGVTEELARQFRERFLREARAAASLSHPGIVTVYDAGEDSDTHTPYIAMEYIDGQTLKQRLDRKDRPDVAWVTAFGAVLAEALHVAHKAGIIHRDIKPANILIRDSDGVVKIADFGVARLKSSDLTQTGAALGSPSYMSPEQVRGLDLDGRSDLFTLAVVLYESLCGRRPFKGEDVVSLAFSIVNDTEVPLSRQSHDLPAALDAFFDRALSKDPAARFADGLAFRDAFVKAAASAAAPGVVAGAAAGAADGMMRTAVDASTVGIAGATQRMRAPAGATRSPSIPAASMPAAPSPAAPRGGRGRLIGLTIGAVAFLVAGIAVAARLQRGTPEPPMRVAFDQPAPPPTVAASIPEPPPAPVVDPNPATPDPPPVNARPRTFSTREVEPVVKPAAKPRTLKVTVPPGTELQLALDGAVGSATSHSGDVVTARLTEPVIVGNRVVLPAGSIVHGTVSSVEPAGKGLADKAGTMTLEFDKVATSTGARAAIAGSFTSTGAGSAGKTTAAIGGGAAGGALLGRVLGHKSKNAALGGLLGAAVGTAAAAHMKGQEIELPAGAPLTVMLRQPVVIDVVP